MKINIEFELEEVEIYDPNIDSEIVKLYLISELKHIINRICREDDLEMPELYVNLSDDSSDYDIMQCNLYTIKLMK